MVKIAFVILVAFVCCNLTGSEKKSDQFTLHSTQTDDDYTIEFRKPKNFDTNKNYTLVYIPDASIGLGSYVLAKDSGWSAELPSNCIVVAIGHIGDYHSKRSRDFIPSDISGYTEKNLGHADKFLAFLKSDIIPFVDKQLPNQKRRVLVGHSFSGLFCLYTALKDEKLFDEYFAISPSVWANNLELLKIEDARAKDHSEFDAKIHVYVGGLEIFNRVISSTNSFYDAVQTRSYKNLVISYETISGANHYSVRKPAVDRIFKSLAE
jgi:predicted alpha/beta superfamily hydrolase